MKLDEIILKRQSCRSYDTKPAAKEDILKCLEAARLAPSACNSQPWKFTVVTEPATKAKLASLLQIVGGNKFADAAPVLVAVSEDECPKLMPGVLQKWSCKHFAHGDIGIAVAHFTLKAAEMGLATCIMGTFEDKDVKELLNIPEGDTVRVVIALGYPADGSVREKNRKKLDEIVRFID
ncbi:MAG TPA: nitroreductase family protein [Synergistaceae bacterium]|jgi:nitroreductase|nr:nitroreductase family protein [Synergistaceae bacterium]NLL40746.1 NAD(P)H nitroreductase [Synergistaceae bacterium]HPX03205.1 nitroreductase family protein [Synergistaceae bacterium]HQA55154.1 nitroreductase family protein [Synergistaceae bacterium]